MRCEISPLAENDLREIGDYIAIGNPERAISFIEELLAHSQRIAPSLATSQMSVIAIHPRDRPFTHNQSERCDLSSFC
jgi:plasmid stabilization system protein ParE